MTTLTSAAEGTSLGEYLSDSSTLTTKDFVRTTISANNLSTQQSPIKALENAVFEIYVDRENTLLLNEDTHVAGVGTPVSAAHTPNKYPATLSEIFIPVDGIAVLESQAILAQTTLPPGVSLPVEPS